MNTEFNTWATKNNIQLIEESNGYKVGDEVIVTNGYGVEWELTIKGIMPEGSKERPDAKVFVYNDCYWFPVPFSDIRKNIK